MTDTFKLPENSVAFAHGMWLLRKTLSQKQHGKLSQKVAISPQNLHTGDVLCHVSVLLGYVDRAIFLLI